MKKLHRILGNLRPSPLQKVQKLTIRAFTILLAIILSLAYPLLATNRAASQQLMTNIPTSTSTPTSTPPIESTKCVVLNGAIPPLVWKWDEEKTKTLLPGSTLNITLGKPEAPAGNQTPATKFTILPASNNPKDPKQDLICAFWNDSGVNPASKKQLTLKPIGSEIGENKLQIQVDGNFPASIRKLILIKLVSVSKGVPKDIALISKEFQLTTKWFCALISSGFLVAIYIILASSVRAYYFHSGHAPNRRRSHGWRILDPTVISAGNYGAASLANFQILWFSLIVAWLMAYAWLLTGRLLDPSLQLLGLLGISGGVNVLAKSLTNDQQRISLDNWNWLVDGKFLLRETDIDPIEVARWRDFVVDRGVLDPSRYQLIIFGFLIGINLLFSDISILETFTIPTFFLALQVLSSGLYLFGKTVNPNTKDELEARINTIKSQDIALITDEDKRYLRRTIESLYGSSAIGDNLKPPKLVLS